MKTAGIVLCGGHSQRMGRSKAWLPFGDQSLLARVVDQIVPIVSQAIVVAAVGQDLPPLHKNARVVRDDEPDRGPLGGLAAGLAAIADECETAYVSSCDAPFVTPAFVQRMIDLLGENAVCVPFVKDRLHPLAAVYRVSVLQTVRGQLTQARLRLVELIEILPARLVRESELQDVDPELRCLRNLNTPEQYQHALRELDGA